MAIKYSKNPQHRNKERASLQRREKVRARRSFLIDLLGGGCTKCHSTENLWFEWTGPKGQAKPWKRLATLMSGDMAILMSEAKKYRLLCSRHWWEAHRKRMGIKKHGTVSMYANRSSLCRCDKCRAAWNEYSKRWHKQKNAKRRAAREALKSAALKKIFTA